MYILIDKIEKNGYAGNDLGVISEESGKNIHTLRSWNRKKHWYEDVRYILFDTELLKSKRGGINEGNKKYFNK